MSEAELHALAANLALASAMVSATVLTHFWGLLLLTRALRGAGGRLRPHESHLRRAALILIVVFGIFALHTVEIWSYAALYRFLGEMHTFEQALYFSTVTFASLGYGDIVLSTRWRVLSAIEAANGVILFAWSTAFLFSVTSRLKVLEHDWLEPRA
ncbi:MAG: potassium channel family protein [Hyphomonadaceae bacterium]